MLSKFGKMLGKEGAGRSWPKGLPSRSLWKDRHSSSPGTGGEARVSRNGIDSNWKPWKKMPCKPNTRREVQL